MRSRLKTGAKVGAAAVAVLLGGATLALSLALSLAPPATLRVGANYSAKMVCSNVFIAGRAAQTVLADDVQAPGHPLLKLMRVQVDHAQQLVRVNLLGLFGDGLAVYRPGTGCAVVADGDIAQAARYRYIPAALPAPDPALPWPQGARAAPVAAVQALLAQPALAGPGMRALVVIHRGQLVAQQYGPGFNASTPLLGWSMTKTVTAALVGLQVADGKLSMQQSGFWPDASDARSHIMLSDLMAMSSGLHYNEGYGDVSDVTRMLYLEPDMARYTASQPLEHPPGKVWNYSSGTTVLLSRIWQQAAAPGNGSAAATLALPQRRLFAPLGMHSAVLEADARGNLVGSSYLYATAQDWARFGQFLLQDGVWNGQRLLPPGFVATMQKMAPASGGQYGQGQVWRWGPGGDTPEGENPDLRFGLPADTYWMRGHDGQSVAIVPSQQLVVVRLGLTPQRLLYQPQALLAEVLKVLAVTPKS